MLTKIFITSEKKNYECDDKKKKDLMELDNHKYIEGKLDKLNTLQGSKIITKDKLYKTKYLRYYLCQEYISEFPYNFDLYDVKGAGDCMYNTLLMGDRYAIEKVLPTYSISYNEIIKKLDKNKINNILQSEWFDFLFNDILLNELIEDSEIYKIIANKNSLEKYIIDNMQKYKQPKFTKQNIYNNFDHQDIIDYLDAYIDNEINKILDIRLESTITTDDIDNFAKNATTYEIIKSVFQEMLKIDFKENKEENIKIMKMEENIVKYNETIIKPLAFGSPVDAYIYHKKK